MLKKIKILQDWYDHNGDNQIGNEFDALVVEDKTHGHVNANLDVGADYCFGINNMKGSDPMFEIVGDIVDQNTPDLSDELQKREELTTELYEEIELLKNQKQEIEDELTTVKAQGLTREHIDGGYVIIPVKFLDKELADEFKGNEDHIITPKEIVAMCASAQLEINKGDVRPTSLNVKLYNAINDFAQDELDSMIEAGKS